MLSPGQYLTQSGRLINLRDVEAVRFELDRLDDWRARWLKLASSNERMRKMGGLQSQQDYIMGRSVTAAGARRLLLEAYWKEMDRKALEPVVAMPAFMERLEIENRNLRGLLLLARGRLVMKDPDAKVDDIDAALMVH